MKVCSKCQTAKPESDFAKRTASKDGLQPRCRRCQSEFYAVWQKANLDQEVARVRRWRQMNALRKKIESLESRAAKAGAVIYDVSEREIRRLLDSVCASCGDGGEVHVDHIVPLSRGGPHSIGNLQPLCRSCNSKKGSRTMMEWRLSRMRETRDYQPVTQRRRKCATRGCRNRAVQDSLCRGCHRAKQRALRLAERERQEQLRQVAREWAEERKQLAAERRAAKSATVRVDPLAKPLPDHLEAQVEALIRAKKARADID